MRISSVIELLVLISPSLAMTLEHPDPTITAPASPNELRDILERKDVTCKSATCNAAGDGQCECASKGKGRSCYNIICTSVGGPQCECPAKF